MPKRANAEDVRYGVGIPAFGEHGHRDHASDALAQTAAATDGVHHLAQQILIGNISSVAGAHPRGALTLELLDFDRRHIAEVFIESVTTLDLLAVYQQRVWARQARSVLVIVSE